MSTIERSNGDFGRAVRIPAADVDAFIAAQNKTAQDRQVEQSQIAQTRQEAEREPARTQAAKQDLEKEIETQAEKLAELSAHKFKAKQEAILAESALCQVAAIGKDYADLKPWLTETVVAAIGAILKDIPVQDRWAGMIEACLERTAERWGLTLLCHPDSFSALSAIVASAKFEGAIAKIERDMTVSPQTCYIKGNSDFFELDLQAQISEIEARLADMVQDPATDEAEVAT